MAKCRRAGAALSQPRGRAGPSGHQAAVRSDAGTEDLPIGRDCAGGYRARSSHSQAAVFSADGRVWEGQLAEGRLGCCARGFQCADERLRRPILANAPELSASLAPGSRAGAHRGLGAPPTENLLRRKPVPARPAPGRAVLALPLPIRRQAEDTFAGLGTYPDAPTARAQLRHRAARRLLAVGIDPSLRRRELRRVQSEVLEAAAGVPAKWLQTG